jgi:formate dehydrogenase major subunit
MVMGPDQNYERGAMDKLQWLVVCDCFETETANFWKRPGLTPAQIALIPTDVYFLPGAYAYEKEGSATNSGRLAQWRDKACDPPKPTTDPTYPDSGAKDELDIVKLLGDRFIPGGGNPIADPQIASLAWPYNTNAAEFQPGATLAESVAKEINGYALVDFTRPAIYGNTAAYTKKDQINSFFDLMDNGQTACGNWLFCGTWQKALNPRTGNYNQMKNRRPIDDHPAQIGIYRDWGYSWPVNRRIIYNRASVYQSGPDFGKPLNPSKWVLWWDATRPNPAYPSVPLGNFDGGCVTGQANDVADGHALSSPSVYMPFIMREEGLARLMGKGTGLTDGVFPEHWEPWETPLDTNPLTGGVGPLVSPYAYPYPGASYADTPGERDAYPIVCTTYRLTEHWHGGGFTRNCPTQFEAQPEPFVEMSVELADELGIANAELVKVSSIRGSINLKACVTKRWKPFVIDGEVIHEVGVPWHWGFAGWNSAPNGTANMLTPFIGDTNTRIPETKVFLVKIEKIP